MNQSYWIAVEDLGVPNRNGRIYSKEVIEEALKDPLVKEKLDTHTLFVEDIRDRRKNEDGLYDCNDLMEVNVSNIIGSVHAINIEDDKLICKIEFYEDLFKDDVKSISCRLAGYGDVDTDGKVSNYTLEKIIAGDAKEEEEYYNKKEN